MNKSTQPANLKEFLSVCENECTHPYCWSQKKIQPSTQPGGVQLSAARCKYCGKGADHRCGVFHACGDCCGNHGELAGIDQRIYEWVGDIAKAHGESIAENESLKARLAQFVKSGIVDQEMIMAKCQELKRKRGHQ
jgi:hypothetical protein